jgi:hypothetical protein
MKTGLKLISAMKACLLGRLLSWNVKHIRKRGHNITSL